MSDDYLKPGDLFTAELWNRVMDRISNIDARVTALQSGTTTSDLAIDNISPSGDLRVGEVVTVTGSNFGVTTGTVEIAIGATTVPSNFIQLVNSSDSKLVFTIPSIPGLPQNGLVLTMTISNRRTSDSINRRFVPLPVSLSGNVYIDYANAVPATVGAGQRLTVNATIQSAASDSADFTLTPHLLPTSLLTGGSLWNLTVLGGNGQPLPNSVIQLGRSQSANVALAVDVPSGTSGQAFAVGLGASAGGVSGTSGLFDFTVGQPIRQYDTSIRFRYSYPSSMVNGVTFQDDTLSVPTSVAGGGSVGELYYELAYPVAGTYAISVSLEGGASGWSAVYSRSQTTTDSGEVHVHMFRISSSANAVAGYMRLTVQNTASGAIPQSKLIYVRLV